MNQRDLIREFMKDKRSYKRASNLWCDGERLFYYRTVLVEWKDNELYINTTKYRPMTTKLQTIIRSTASQEYPNVEPKLVKDLYFGVLYLHDKSV